MVCAVSYRLCGHAQGVSIPRVTLTVTGFAKETHMNRIIYIVGFVVIVLAILGFLGLR